MAPSKRRQGAGAKNVGDKQQQFSIWYFFVSLLLILAIQIYLLRPHPEVITYSQFKSLVKQGLVTDVVVEKESVRGNIKAEGIKQVFSEEKLKQLKHDPSSPLLFTTVRVEDPALTAELEAAGIYFPGGGDSERLAPKSSSVVPRG